LLETKNLSVFYDEICVCQGVSLQVDAGEAVCLLGRNGVGKTTLLKCLMRHLPCRQGAITFDGRDVTGLKPYEMARLGVGYVPQGRMIFPDLSVRDNLKLGTMARARNGGDIPEIVFEYFPRLKERLGQRGGTLSGGEQQMLAVGRALASVPKLVLLDEPSEGLSAAATHELIEVLLRLRREMGMSILLVEQNLDMALETATRGYVMEKGCIVAQGSVDELEDDEIVKSHLVI
jgi:urea transport system ATP-binding protein